MTSYDIINLMKAWGHNLKTEHIAGFLYYFRQMVHKNRVATVSDEHGVQAVIFFYLTNDYRLLYKKDIWALALDKPSGCQVYVDKLVCREWNLEIRRKFQDFIESTFPNVTEAYYHRAPKDRCVRIKRRSRVACIA